MPECQCRTKCCKLMETNDARLNLLSAFWHPWWMSISISMVHVHVHGACPCPWCMSMSMVHVHVHGACPCPWCMSLSMVHVLVHGACPCPWCMSMSMVHVHIVGVCLCQCCVPVFKCQTVQHPINSVPYWKKLRMLGPVRYRAKPTQSSTLWSGTGLKLSMPECRCRR